VRAEEAPEVIGFKAKMETEEAKSIYRRRGEVAEFPNAWLKEKMRLRQFRLRGLLKVGIGGRYGPVWPITYNSNSTMLETEMENSDGSKMNLDTTSWRGTMLGIS
jgi:hypothetical protein